MSSSISAPPGSRKVLDAASPDGPCIDLNTESSEREESGYVLARLRDMAINRFTRRRLPRSPAVDDRYIAASTADLSAASNPKDRP
jgi:hypothetical protein